MTELTKHCIENGWGFLAFAVGCYLLLHGIRQHLPEVRHLIVELVSLLLRELIPGRGKSVPERINAVAIVVLFIIAVLAGIPSAIKHSIGGELSESVEHTFFAAIICLSIVAVGSPVWLWVMQREKRIHETVRNAAKHR